MNTTYYWANKLVDFHFRSAALAKPTVWYYGLFTVAPTDAGGGTELVGGSYARVNLPPLDTNYLATQGGTAGNSSGTTKVTRNAPIISYPTPTANWGTIVAFGLFDALTVGNLCFWDPLQTSIPINTADAPIYVDVGGFVFTVG